MTTKPLQLFMGDNPFHGISHLSQTKARTRTLDMSRAEQAAELVALGLQNGADGFMFSVDEVTLSIIRTLTKNGSTSPLHLYAIAPYAYEYIRRATSAGGVAGLAANLAREMVFSSNIKVVASNAAGIVRFDLSALLRTYVAYELARIKAVLGKNGVLECFMLHEIVTDMMLALDLKDLCRDYIKFLEANHVRAGFETRNFPYLVDKFEDWNVDLAKLTLTASFNSVGFQMCPSQRECEEALKRASKAEVVAMSVLAAGYLKPQDAAPYLQDLEGLSGLVIGVSKERQAKETFRAFKEKAEITVRA